MQSIYKHNLRPKIKTCLKKSDIRSFSKPETCFISAKTNPKTEESNLRKKLNQNQKLNRKDERHFRIVWKKDYEFLFFCNFHFISIFSFHLKEIDKIKMEVRNQLVLQKKESHEKEKSTKALRDSILFEEVLTKNVDLCLYDCLGYAYRRFCLKNLAWMSILAFVVLLISLSDNVKKKNKNKTLILGSLWLGLGLFFMRRFQKNHVERIIYHTNEKKFTLVKKTFFGGEKNVVVHKNNLMYTQDESLNRKNVNYINVENLETYKIGFVYAWKEKELFAYLIGQNVK